MVIPEVHILYYSTLGNLQNGKDKGPRIINCKNGDTWKLYYMSDDEEDDLFDCVSWNESFGLTMDREQY